MWTCLVIFVHPCSFAAAPSADVCYQALANSQAQLNISDYGSVTAAGDLTLNVPGIAAGRCAMLMTLPPSMPAALSPAITTTIYRTGLVFKQTKTKTRPSRPAFGYHLCSTSDSHTHWNQLPAATTSVCGRGGASEELKQGGENYAIRIFSHNFAYFFAYFGSLPLCKLYCVCYCLSWSHCLFVLWLCVSLRFKASSLNPSPLLV